MKIPLTVELTGLEINCIQVGIDDLIDHLEVVLKEDKKEVHRLTPLTYYNPETFINKEKLSEAKLCAEETAERLASAENVKKAFALDYDDVDVRFCFTTEKN